jgi:hypothetical protein
MFQGTASVLEHITHSPQTFLTNPSKLRIYPCKIPAVITETLIVNTREILFFVN